MRIDVVTIFPAYLEPLRQSLPGKAIESGLVDLQVHDLRRWTPDVILEVAIHLVAEARVVLRRGVSLLQLENERHQRLGDETAAIEPEMPALVGSGAERVELLDGHARLMALSGAARLPAPSRAAAMKARILS